MKLYPAREKDFEMAMGFINTAKRHLRDQGIDQWQKGYPDEACIHRDIANGKGYLLMDGAEAIGYLCIDFDGEPAYENLNGEWQTGEEYVVVHRLAFSDQARGKGLSTEAFRLVEQMALERGVSVFRVDTDADNKKMQHVLAKSGFTYRGTIWFDNSEKIAFDKTIV